jgi:hypothetical protein
MNVNTSVGLPLVKAQAETNGYLVTLYQASVPVAEGHIIWPRPDFIQVAKDEVGNHHKIKITATCSLILITKVLRPNSIHRRHGQCLSWIFDHEKQAVVTTSTLRTRGAIFPISSSIRMSDSDMAALPCVNATEPFTLSISADGEPFTQMVDQDQVIADNDDEHDEPDLDGYTENKEPVDMSSTSVGGHYIRDETSNRILLATAVACPG